MCVVHTWVTLPPVGIPKNHLPPLSYHIIGSGGNMREVKTFGSLGCCTKSDRRARDDIPEVIRPLRCPRHNDVVIEETGPVPTCETCSVVILINSRRERSQTRMVPPTEPWRILVPSEVKSR